MRSRLLPALVAGSVAIIINTLALKAADLVPLATAKGGLLRLLASWFASLLGWLGIVSAWSQVGLPDIASPIFQTGFHLAVGMLMALFYAYLVEPLLPMRDVFKGASYALAVWLLNAFAVLPATGEGIAGIVHLTPAGIAWYAVAHSEVAPNGHVYIRVRIRGANGNGIEASYEMIQEPGGWRIKSVVTRPDPGLVLTPLRSGEKGG